MRQRLVEVAGPLLVGVAPGDDLCGLRIGHVEAQPLLAQQPGRTGVFAATGQARRPVAEEFFDLAVAEGRARHRQGQLHAQRQFAGGLQPAVGVNHLRSDAVPLESGCDPHGARLPGGVAQPCVPILIGEPWHAFEQRVLKDGRPIALEEEPGRIARRVLHDFNLVGRHRVSRDAGHLKRPAVGDRRQRQSAPPAPRRADVDRVVRCGPIEVMAVRKAPLPELACLEYVALGRCAHRERDNPLSLRRMRGGIAHGIADFGHRPAMRDLHSAKVTQAHAVEVRMRIEEAGHHRTAFEVDHSSALCASRQQRSTRACRDDATIGDRQGLDRAALAIQRVDPAVVQDEVGDDV